MEQKNGKKDKKKIKINVGKYTFYAKLPILVHFLCS